MNGVYNNRPKVKPILWFLNFHNNTLIAHSFLWVLLSVFLILSLDSIFSSCLFQKIHYPLDKLY